MLEICQHNSPMPTCSLHGSQAFITIQFLISYSLHTGGENGLGTRLYLTYTSTKYRFMHISKSTPWTHAMMFTLTSLAGHCHG